MCQPRHRGRGELAEWLRRGLQIRVQEFDSPTRLHLFSMACVSLVIARGAPFTGAFTVLFMNCPLLPLLA